MAKVFFEEIRVKGIINRVKSMPFMFTINPYRGCQHACAYCYARGSHRYFGYDPGYDFQERIQVKVNAPELLRAELRKRSWNRHSLLIGANVDPYQPAEQQYRLTRSIINILKVHSNPFSIITKSPSILQDIDMYREMAKLGLVRVLFSVGTLDHEVWRKLEPQAPKPEKRIEAMGELVKAGVPAGIMLAPIVPRLSDSIEGIEAVIKMAAEHGAHFINPIVLHLRPGAKEWFMSELKREYPGLVQTFSAMYKGSYAPRKYQQVIQTQAHELKIKWEPQERYIPPPRINVQLSLDLDVKPEASSVK